MAFCSRCGGPVEDGATKCANCGEELGIKQPTIVINNSNTNTNTNLNAAVSAAPYGKRVRQRTAFWLCVFLGWAGAHKFYEGKIVMGIIYILTCGLVGIGWLIDIFAIMAKPKPYYYV